MPESHVFDKNRSRKRQDVIPKIGPPESKPSSKNLLNKESEFIELIRQRRMERALRIFNDHSKEWSNEIYSPVLIDSFARLLDREPAHLSFVSDCIRRFEASSGAGKTEQTIDFGKLTSADTAHLMLAKAVVKFHSGDYLSAIEDLRFLCRLADYCEDDDLQKMTRYYLSRALLRTGSFKEAREEIQKAEDIGPHEGVWFDLLMTKTWIVFNEDSAEEAAAVLKDAEQLLNQRDYVDHANVMTVQGRFARQQGDFERAAELAREAIGIFEKNDDNHHLSLARAHVHRAFALLLRAQNEGFRPLTPEFDELRSEAFDHFREAQKICGDRHHRILDRIHYFKAAWYFYLEDISRARAEADLAYQSAERVSDFVIMAHCRILQTQCARVRNAPDDASRWAMEADYLANKTDNRRIKIRALISRAMTEADPPRKNQSMAQKLLDEARRGLRATDRDYLRWEFDDLQRQVRALQGVENTIALHLTLDDVLNDKSLDRTLERLAANICEAVYAKRAGSIQRTAQLLGISRNRVKALCRNLKDQKIDWTNIVK